MDADLSHPAAALPKMISKLEAGKDVVIGSRYLGGVNVVNWPLSRIALSMGASIYVRLITGLAVKDLLLVLWVSRFGFKEISFSPNCLCGLCLSN